MKNTLRSHLPTSLRATEIKPYHVLTWIAKCEKDSKRVKKFSNDTKHKYIAFAQRIWNWGRKYGYLQTTPLADMEKPTPIPRQDFLAPSLFADVLAIAKTQEVKDYITFFLDTGCRATEVFKMEAKHFDEPNARMVFDIEDSKGRKRSRVIYLPPVALKIVKRLCEKHPEGKLFRTSEGGSGGHGRLRGKGIPWDKNSINRELRKLLATLNEKRTKKIASICGTALRHSYCHYRLSQGQSPETVAKLMGHQSTRMIYERYGHMEKGDILKDAAKEIPLPQHKPKKEKGDDDKAA